MLIDGPKGSEGFNLAKKCYEYDNVYFAALHDYNSTECFSLRKYDELDNLIQSVTTLNAEHPGFKSNPRGYDLSILK